MDFDKWVKKRADKKENIMVGGRTPQEVIDKGARIEDRYDYSPASDVLQSEVTGQWYQHWAFDPPEGPEHVSPEELGPYENKWVALDRSGARERIVGSGDTLGAAMREAAANGCADATAMKVPRSDAGHA